MTAACFVAPSDACSSTEGCRGYPPGTSALRLLAASREVQVDRKIARPSVRARVFSKRPSDWASAGFASPGSSPLKRDARGHSRVFDCRLLPPRCTSATFGFFARRSQRLARFISRESHHLVTRPSFGLSTREDARLSNLSREKACRIDRSCAMRTAFGRTFDIADVKYASKRKNEQEAHDR